mgnify:CR=1 FL=1
MFGATLQAALTLLVAAVLATYVQLRARPAPLRVPLQRVIDDVAAAFLQCQPQAEDDFFRHALRLRKLLLHRREIDRLRSNVERDGYTLVPLAMRWDKGKVKVTLGLAKGKKNQDKRETIKDRDWQRQKSRLLRRG